MSETWFRNEHPRKSLYQPHHSVAEYLEPSASNVHLARLASDQRSKKHDQSDYKRGAKFGSKAQRATSAERESWKNSQRRKQSNVYTPKREDDNFKQRSFQSKIKYNDEQLKLENEKLKQELMQNNEQLKQKDKELLQLKQNNEQLRQNNEQLKQNNEQLKQKDEELRQKDKELLQLKQKDRQKDEELMQTTEQLKQKDEQLRQKDEELMQTDEQLKQKDRQKDEELMQTDEQLKQKDEQLRQKDEEPRQKDEELMQTDEQLKQKDEQLRQNDEELKQKDEQLKQLNEQQKQNDEEPPQKYEQLNQICEQQTAIIESQHSQVEQLNLQVEQRNHQIEQRNHQIEQHNHQIEQLRESLVQKDKEIKNLNEKLLTVEEDSYKYTNAFTSADDNSVLGISKRYRHVQHNMRASAVRASKSVYKIPPKRHFCDQIMAAYDTAKEILMEESSKYINKFLLTLQPKGDTWNQENIKTCMKFVNQTLTDSKISEDAIEKIYKKLQWCDTEQRKDDTKADPISKDVSEYYQNLAELTWQAVARPIPMVYGVEENVYCKDVHELKDGYSDDEGKEITYIYPVLYTSNQWPRQIAKEGRVELH